MIKRMSVEKVTPVNGSNVIAWNSSGEKQTCYYVKEQFKFKYGLDRGKEFENVTHWSYAILDDRQSYLFDQFAILLAMSNGEAEVMQFSSTLDTEKISALLSEIKKIKHTAIEYCKEVE